MVRNGIVVSVLYLTHREIDNKVDFDFTVFLVILIELGRLIRKNTTRLKHQPLF